MKTVQILLFDGVDELDLCGPYEALASCRKLINGRWGDKAAFHVETVAEHRTTVECAHGLKVSADRSLDHAHPSDILIVPGGPGARRESVPPHILEFLRDVDRAGGIIASISTGVFLLARAGLTDGHEVTTHHCQFDNLAKMYPRTRVVRDQRVVTSGRARNLVTSAGISAGIDLALCLITRLEGTQCAVLAGKRLEWPGYYPHHEHAPHADAPRPVGLRPAA